MAGGLRTYDGRTTAHLTENITVEALPGLEAALRDLHEHVVDAVRSGRSRTDVVRDNHLPPCCATS